MAYGIINYIYKHNKSWNCTKVCESENEFFTWVKHEEKYNSIVFIKDNIVNCYIDY